MIIDTKFNRGDAVYFICSNRIEGGVIKAIEVNISPDYTVIPTIVYKMTSGVQLVNPRILCATKKEVAEALLNE